MPFCLDLKHPKTGICGLKLPKYCEVVERSWNSEQQTALSFVFEPTCHVLPMLGYTDLPTKLLLCLLLANVLASGWMLLVLLHGSRLPPTGPTKTRRVAKCRKHCDLERCFRSLKKMQFLSPPKNAENLDGKQDLPKSPKMLQDSSLGKVGGDSANSKSGKSGGTCNHLLSFTCWRMNDRWTCMNFHLLYLMAVENIWNHALWA